MEKLIGESMEIDYSMESQIVISALVREYRIKKAVENAISEWNTKYAGKDGIPKQQEWIENRALEIFRSK
jgi:hypothetical protein